MEALPQLDFTKFVEAVFRRKGIVIAVFLVIFSLSVNLAVTLPNVYRSSTVILTTPQRIPTAYIQPTVSINTQERIQVMTQQIMSRGKLEKIINELNLYPPSTERKTMEERIAAFRKSIQVNVQPNDAFQISFESESPQTAMRVASRLASLFIEENLQVREEQAAGTTVFLNAESERLRKELEQQESLVNHYRAQYQFELPDQLDANLRTREQLRQELQTNMTRLSSLQERMGNLERQVVEAETVAPEVVRGRTMVVGGSEIAPERDPFASRKSELEALLMVYSERHPDVIRLRNEIHALQTGKPALQTGRPALQTGMPTEKSQTKRPAPNVVGSIGNPVQQMLIKQSAELKAEISSLQSANEHLQRQIASYQARIDNTPLRGTELSRITRNYDITLRKYQDLMGKGLESQLSENMEKKQKGQQFQIIDAASFPGRPVRPNRQLILFVGFLVGLGGGFGFAFLLENLNTSFKTRDDLDGYINLPLLATIPGVMTQGTVLEQRRAQAVLFIASIGTFVIGIICIRLFSTMLF